MRSIWSIWIALALSGALTGLARKNNVTQAKAWAEFSRPFGPKPPSNPTHTQAKILSALRALLLRYCTLSISTRPFSARRWGGPGLSPLTPSDFAISPQSFETSAGARRTSLRSRRLPHSCPLQPAPKVFRASAAI